MYNCVKCVHLCIYKFDGLILLASLDFKTSWKMFTQRGEYVAQMFYIENEIRVSSAIVKYRDFTDSLIKAKIMGISSPRALSTLHQHLT